MEVLYPRARGRGNTSKDKPTAVENSKTEGADLQQYEFGDYETLKWRFTRNNVGMYVIQSLHSGLYMGVTEMSDESGLQIEQYESPFMRQTQWAVMRSESGNLILQSSAAMRLGEITSVLSLPSGTSGLTFRWLTAYHE